MALPEAQTGTPDTTLGLLLNRVSEDCEPSFPEPCPRSRSRDLLVARLAAFFTDRRPGPRPGVARPRTVTSLESSRAASTRQPGPWRASSFSGDLTEVSGFCFGLATGMMMAVRVFCLGWFGGFVCFIL